MKLAEFGGKNLKGGALLLGLSVALSLGAGKCIGIIGERQKIRAGKEVLKVLTEDICRERGNGGISIKIEGGLREMNYAKVEAPRKGIRAGRIKDEESDYVFAIDVEYGIVASRSKFELAYCEF